MVLALVGHACNTFPFHIYGVTLGAPSVWLNSFILTLWWNYYDTKHGIT